MSAAPWFRQLSFGNILGSALGLGLGIAASYVFVFEASSNSIARLEQNLKLAEERSLDILELERIVARLAEETYALKEAPQFVCPQGTRVSHVEAKSTAPSTDDVQSYIVSCSAAGIQP